MHITPLGKAELRHASLASGTGAAHVSEVVMLAPQLLPPGAEICRRQTPLLLWIAHGALHLERHTGNCGWRSMPLRDGDFYFVAAESVRLRRAPGCQLAFEGIQLHIGAELLARCRGEAEGNPVHSPAREMAGVPDPTMRTLLDLLHSACSPRIPSSPSFVDGVAQALVSQLVSYPAHKHCDSGPPQGLPPYKFRLVARAMREGLAEPFDLARLAQLAGLSVFHFSRSFKKTCGLTPSRYFQRLRVESAKRMLLDSGQAVIDIAMALGYRTPSHFSQVFREVTGVSPTEYRLGSAAIACPDDWPAAPSSAA